MMQPPPVIAGAVSIGAPGMPQQVYNAANLPALIAALTLHEAAQPWIVPPSTLLLQDLMTPAVTYNFDTLAQCFDWTRIRVFTSAMLTMCQGGPGGREARAWQGRYNLINGWRQQFQAAGNANGPFQILGHGYTLNQQAANHYYIYRNGQSVLYSGNLKVSDALAILRMLNALAQNQPVNLADSDVAMVDEFACAFLAEPTRWPEEQVFNLLALQAGPATPLTGQGATLPMASGSTWEPGLGVLARETPKRIVLFAGRIGLIATIVQELAASNSLVTFLANMRVQYQAT